MFGLGKPEDEKRMRDRNSINGVKMGSVFQGLYEANKIKEEKAADENIDEYEFSSVSVCGQETTVHVNDGQAVNIFVNGKFVYGPVVGEADVTLK